MTNPEILNANVENSVWDSLFVVGESVDQISHVKHPITALRHHDHFVGAVVEAELEETFDTIGVQQHQSALSVEIEHFEKLNYDCKGFCLDRNATAETVNYRGQEPWIDKVINLLGQIVADVSVKLDAMEVYRVQ